LCVEFLPAREENKVLKEKVKNLSARVSLLEVENEALKAEAEIYRRDASTTLTPTSVTTENIYQNPLVSVESSKSDIVADSIFIQSGNGIYVQDPPTLLFSKIHQSANPLCCALCPDDLCLVVGGADSNLRFVPWQFYTTTSSSSNHERKSVIDMSSHASDVASYLACDAPVLCAAISPVLRNVVVAGCMDGRIQCAKFHSNYSGSYKIHRQMALPDPNLLVTLKHGKFVNKVVWSPTEPIVATSSADGTIFIYKALKTGLDLDEITLTRVETLHLEGSVEALEFVNAHTLICYVRDMCQLLQFDLSHCLSHCHDTSTGNHHHHPIKRSFINLNSGTLGTAGFDDHVSFAVMDIQTHSSGVGTAATCPIVVMATDTSRNIVMDLRTHKIVRNLYGHSNDHYSHPRAKFSYNGQYVYGNSQDDGTVAVWDIATSKIVTRLHGATLPIRDMFSSCYSDTLVTTSFDKMTNIWHLDNKE
jgi:WD40 repeat protein